MNVATSAQPKLRISELTIQQTISTLIGEGNVCELRALGVEGRKRTDAGYFDDFSKAASEIAHYARTVTTKGCYLVLNQIDRSLLSRANNRIERFASLTTSDKDVTRRRWLYVDCDPKRPAGISSTNAECQLAIERTEDVREWLMTQGCSEPIIAMSGNGAHLLVPIDLPNDEESLTLVKNVLAVLDDLFSDDLVDVDTSVCNAARICRLYGTPARKGDSTPERPHRVSELRYVPDYLRGAHEATPGDVLQAIAAMMPQETSKPAAQQRTSVSSNVQRHILFPLFLQKNGIEYRSAPGSKGEIFQIDCPFDENHKSPDAYVGQIPNGALVFHCSHNSCSHRGWSDFTDAVGKPDGNDWNPPLSAKAEKQNDFRQSVDDSSLKPEANRANVDSIPELKAEPFPVDVLPDRFRQMAESISEAVGVDVSFAVLPMFTACSTAIGNSRCVSTKPGNSQPLMLWTAVVGSSGSQKSEPFSHAEEPIRKIDGDVIRAWQQSLASHEEQMKLYKLDFKEWTKDRQGEMPAEPVKPPRARLVLTDFTYESMVESHAGTPRGITISCEELSAWFGSFDRYNGKGAASPEQARYLQAYDGKALTSDRISGFRFVPRAFVNVSGTIQPGILAKCFTDESRQNGLASRLWMTYPEGRPIKWTDAVVSTTAKTNYDRLVRDLWELRPGQIDADKWPVPAELPFNREAQILFAEFFNRTGQDAFSAAEDAKAAMTKFIGRCARIAGVLHCCEQVNGDAMDAFEIQPETVERAIRISEWSLSEAHRIYRLLMEPDEVRHIRGLAGWLRHQGGRMTARDVARNRRDIETTEQAELVLIQLVSAGLGTWQPIHKSREFVLNPDPLSTNAP